jgi:hypothetical protein
VGLDDKTILADLRAELDRQEPAAPPREIHQFEVGDPAKTPSRLLSWLAGVLVLIVIALGLVFWRSSYWPAAELPPLVGPSRSLAVAPAPTAPAAPAPAASGPFTALDDGIWVKFYDGAGVQLCRSSWPRAKAGPFLPECRSPDCGPRGPTRWRLRWAGNRYPASPIRNAS